jgi:DNA-binding transcriptional LysR family regulator
MRTFLAVWEEGGAGRAARVLGLSQPAVSRRLAALEAELGTPLFVRAGRGLKPAAAAQALGEHARRMRECARAAKDWVERDAREASGVVRVSASEIVACYALPQIVARLAADHPAIQIELEASNALANLLDREADIAVRMAKPAQGGLVARRLPDVPAGFYASKAYVARNGAPRTAQDLLDLRLIGYDRSDLILAGARKARIPVTRASFAFRSDHQIACWQMARAGLGVGIVANFVGGADPAMERLLPEIPLPPMPMWLAARKDMRSTARLRTVFEALAKGLSRLTAAPP